MELLEICKQAKAIAPKIGILDTNTKNQALLAVADFLVKEQNSIITTIFVLYYFKSRGAKDGFFIGETKIR